MVAVAQSITLIFVGLVVLTTILEFNDTTYDAGVKRVVRGIEAGLGYFFVAYVILIGSHGKGREMEMYKYFIVLLSVASWVLLFLRNPEGTGDLDRVTAQVAQPIFEGSLFALPIVAFGGY